MRQTTFDEFVTLAKAPAGEWAATEDRVRGRLDALSPA